MEWEQTETAIFAKPVIFKTISGSIFHGYLFRDNAFWLYHPIFNSGELITKFPKDFVTGWRSVL